MRESNNRVNSDADTSNLVNFAVSFAEIAIAFAFFA